MNETSPSSPPRVPPNWLRWMPAVAAAAVLILVGIVAAGGDGSESDAAGTTTSVATTTIVATTTTTAPQVPLGRTLTRGLAGDDVAMIQQRLHDLDFDPGPIDGIYGTMTIQAVWAFEKLVLGVPRTEMTGQVTPAVWDRMQDPIDIRPRRTTGGLSDHIEVYLPEQVMVVFHADDPVLITHVSSGELDEFGEPALYCETVTYDTDNEGNLLEEPVTRDVCAYAKTPGGVFTVRRMVDGIRNGPLGDMWSPVYFNFGIAIHGAINVPESPASHGCVRIPMHISEYFQTLVDKGDRVLVWNGVSEPEDVTYAESLPSFDGSVPNPSTTTTSTTTTSTTTTTVAPEVPESTTTSSTTTTSTTPTTSPSTTTTTTTVPTVDVGAEVEGASVAESVPVG